MLLADIGDLLEELHDPGGWLKNYYQILYGWVPYRYKRSNFKAAVKRILKVGYIERSVKNGEVYIRLTSGGKKKLVRDFPTLAFRKKKWDGTCTLFTFDIREIERIRRNKFRGWVYSIGAGQMQKSVYLLPYDLACEMCEVVENFGLEKEVKVFLTSLNFIRDQKAFAYKVWRLEKLEKKYSKVLEDLKYLGKMMKEKRDREKLLKEIRSGYLRVLIADPLLPKELLPEDWIGERVKRLLKTFIFDLGDLPDFSLEKISAIAL